MKILIARYQEGGKDRLLRIVGPITKEAIEKVFVPNRACSYSPENPQEGWKGTASFYASSESACPSLVEKIKPDLKNLGFDIQYRGRIAIPKNSLESLKTKSDLFSLVMETLSDEAHGRIDPKELEEIDYQEALSRLPK